jgi:hypothetical protein
MSYISIFKITSLEKYYFNKQKNLQFYLEKELILVANDTNDVILSYFTFSNQLDSQKIISLTEKYYLNIVDVLNEDVKKVELPFLLKDKITKSKPVIQFCQCNDSIYFFLLKDSLIKWIKNYDTFQTNNIQMPLDYNTDRFYLSVKLINQLGFPMYCDKNNLKFGSFLVDKNIGKWTFNVNPSTYQLNYSITDSKSFTSKFIYPDFVYVNHYGLNFKIYRQVAKDNDIISFPFSSNIYRVSTIKNMVDTIGGKSKYQTSDFIKPLSSKHQMNQISSDSEWYYYIHTEKYSQLIYNSNTKQYYRLYYHHIPLKKSDGLYYTHKDRVISLQVFNEQFSLVHEEILDDIWFVLHFLPYKNGFLINNNGIDPKKENYEYLYYKVFSK